MSDTQEKLEEILWQSHDMFLEWEGVAPTESFRKLMQDKQIPAILKLIESAKRDGADAIERLLPNPDKIDSYDRSDLLDVLDNIRDRLTQLKQSEESI